MSSPTVDNNDATTLDALRELLLSPDRENISDAYRRLDILEERLNNPATRVKDISEVIVPVFIENLATEKEFHDVLQPVLVEQFHKTARDKPDVMAEALFPILGPAIRKMIGNLISPDKNTRKRNYRLEQLLLIDKESGLPLCQVASSAVVSQDADMVSGMLTAIQSFVHDAFSANEFDGLNTLQVGDLSVWIEWGPSSVLAAVVRGTPPHSLREAMQLYVEKVHASHSDALSNYSGDSSQFDTLTPELTHLLDNHDGSLKNSIRNLPSKLRRWLFVGIALTALVVGWTAYNMNDARQWENYVHNIDSIPGVVVISNERHFRDYRISGLKDPLVAIPDSFQENTDINPDHISYQFEAYQALHPTLVIERLKAIVEIPTGVSISLEGSILTVEGDIDYGWLESFRNRVSSIEGVNRVVYSGG